METDIDFLVLLHGRGNLNPFFSLAGKFFSRALPSAGRPKNCSLTGNPGSGKSVLVDLITTMLPDKRIFRPVLESSAPFAAIRPHHLLSVCDDWRFSAKAQRTWARFRGGYLRDVWVGGRQRTFCFSNSRLTAAPSICLRRFFFDPSPPSKWRHSNHKLNFCA